MEQLLSTVATILLGGVVGLFAAKWQNEKARADVVSIYQKMALTETLERERVEAKLDAEIKVLKEDRKTLEERLAAVLVELRVLQTEKDTWGVEKADLLDRLRKQQKEINQLRSAIENLKRQTGSLK